MKSHEAIDEAVRKVGVKQVAWRLRVSSSLVYKWCQPRGRGPAPEASGTRNPLDRVAALWDCTGDVGLLDWLCRRADGFFVPDPTPDHPLDAEYVAQTQQLIKRFSELLTTLSESIIDDGRVDPKEARRIRRHWQELKRRGESFAVACERGVFGPDAPSGPKP